MQKLTDEIRYNTCRNLLMKLESRVINDNIHLTYNQQLYCQYTVNVNIEMEAKLQYYWRQKD